jgi:hypothetical protein
MKDLHAISEKTGISEFLFKDALGIPSEICSAATIEEARTAYEQSASSSEMERAALKRWLELCTTIEGVQEVCGVVPSGSGIEEEAFAKLNVLFSEKIDKAQTPEEMADIFNDISDDSPMKKIALERWNSISMERANAAMNIAEAKDACENAPENSEAERIALFRWISLCTTVDEIQEAYEKTACNTDAENVAIEKWDAISSEQIVAASTITEVREVYRKTYDHGKAEDIALEKWFSFCTTIGELVDIYDQLPGGREIGKKILLKIYELS